MHPPTIQQTTPAQPTVQIFNPPQNNMIQGIRQPAQPAPARAPVEMNDFVEDTLTGDQLDFMDKLDTNKKRNVFNAIRHYTATAQPSEEEEMQP